MFSLFQVKQVEPRSIDYPCMLLVIFVCFSLARWYSGWVLISWSAFLTVDIIDLPVYFCLHLEALIWFHGCCFYDFEKLKCLCLLCWISHDRLHFQWAKVLTKCLLEHLFCPCTSSCISSVQCSFSSGILLCPSVCISWLLPLIPKYSFTEASETPGSILVRDRSILSTTQPTGTNCDEHRVVPGHL